MSLVSLRQLVSEKIYPVATCNPATCSAGVSSHAFEQGVDVACKKLVRCECVGVAELQLSCHVMAAFLRKTTNTKANSAIASNSSNSGWPAPTCAGKWIFVVDLMDSCADSLACSLFHAYLIFVSRKLMLQGRAAVSGMCYPTLL